MMKENPNLPKIIIICGPTGIGKTSSCIEIASLFSGEIISADSMQIYKYMDIGTAKPTLDEQRTIKHYMIDVIEPDKNFSAALFSEMAGEIIYGLHEKKIPVFVTGGTGLYIKTLVYGIFKDERLSESIREDIKKEISEKGLDLLYERLRKKDPRAAAKINRNDSYRIIRALEVFEATGERISSCQERHGFMDKKFIYYKIGLETDRETIYERINCRVDKMIEQGFIEEVKSLLKRGYSRDLKSMQSIGYRHISDFLEGKISLDNAVDTIKRDTRRYAKRQMTWFKADKEIVWINPDDILSIAPSVRNFLYGKSCM